METGRRINWSRIATMARPAEADTQTQRESAPPAQAPPPTFTRQRTLPVGRVPVVPLPVTQPRAPAPPLTQPTSQPILQTPVAPPAVQPAQPTPRPVTPPIVQPAQPTPRPVTPPIVQPAQPTPRLITPPPQDIPKPVVPASNGVSKPLTAPSPPPSPKVIKTSTPTPPPSPRVKVPPQVPPISASNDKTANLVAETRSAPVPLPLRSIAMQDNNNKVNGNGAPYNNGSSKVSNGGNGKSTSSDTNRNNISPAPQPERKETETGKEARAKPPHSNWGTALPNSGHKKSEKDMKVITIAGENIGALMELGHNVHGYKMHHGGKTPTSGPPAQDGKASENMAHKGTTRSKPTTSLVNSNVQSINNSLLFNSSCTQKSPGVHLIFKSKSKGKAQKPGHSSTSS